MLLRLLFQVVDEAADLVELFGREAVEIVGDGGGHWAAAQALEGVFGRYHGFAAGLPRKKVVEAAVEYHAQPFHVAVTYAAAFVGDETARGVAGEPVLIQITDGVGDVLLGKQPLEIEI